MQILKAEKSYLWNVNSSSREFVQNESSDESNQPRWKPKMSGIVSSIIVTLKATNLIEILDLNEYFTKW